MARPAKGWRLIKSIRKQNRCSGLGGTEIREAKCNATVPGRGEHHRGRERHEGRLGMLNGKSVLVTGGTGSFGKAFLKTVLARYPGIGRLVVYSRDELKQFELRQTLSEQEYPALRYFLGDIRDRDRLRRGLEGVDIVVHAAALKQVPAAEYNPFEFIKTNVLGAQNLIEACMDTKVS